MTLVEEFLTGKLFGMNVTIKSKHSDEIIMRTHYADCHARISEVTGYTEIMLKHRVYLVFERITYDQKIRYNENTNILYVTFFV